jgi:small-conductance mechanosensitive channel
MGQAFVKELYKIYFQDEIDPNVELPAYLKKKTQTYDSDSDSDSESSTETPNTGEIQKELDAKSRQLDNEKMQNIRKQLRTIEDNPEDPDAEGKLKILKIQLKAIELRNKTNKYNPSSD